VQEIREFGLFIILETYAILDKYICSLSKKKKRSLDTKKKTYVDFTRNRLSGFIRLQLLIVDTAHCVIQGLPCRFAQGTNKYTLALLCQFTKSGHSKFFFGFLFARPSETVKLSNVKWCKKFGNFSWDEMVRSSWFGTTGGEAGQKDIMRNSNTDLIKTWGGQFHAVPTPTKTRKLPSQLVACRT